MGRRTRLSTQNVTNAMHVQGSKVGAITIGILCVHDGVPSHDHGNDSQPLGIRFQPCEEAAPPTS